MFERIQTKTLPALTDLLNSWGVDFSESGVVWILIHLMIVILALIIARSLSKLILGNHQPNADSTIDSPEAKSSPLTQGNVSILIFCLLLWACVFVFDQYFTQGNSFTLTIIASIASAWLANRLVKTLVTNQLVGKTLGLAIWLGATLSILHVMPDTLAVLRQTSVDIGSFHSSVLSILKGALIFVFAIWISLLLGKLIERQLNHIEVLSPSFRVLITKVVKTVLVIVALLIGLAAFGIDYTALAVFSGAIGLGIGFGLRNIVSNLFGGIILLIDKSIKPGDVITVNSQTNETFGKINYLAARYVSVVARDGREFLIPNEDLIVNQVINWSFSSDLVRQDVCFRTGYDADPYHVRELACQAASTHPRVVSIKPPVCHISEFADSSINYVLRFWIKDPESGVMNIRGDIFLLLWDQFKAHNINIPYPHRQLLIDKESSEPIKG